MRTESSGPLRPLVMQVPSAWPMILNSLFTEFFINKKLILFFLLVFSVGGRYNTDTGLPVVVGGSLHLALVGEDAEGFFLCSNQFPVLHSRII